MAIGGQCDIMADRIGDKVGRSVPQHQDLRRNACFAQLDGFIGSRHGQQADSFLLQHFGNTYSTVSIGIRLDDTDDFCSGRKTPPNSLQIATNCR